MIYSASKKIRYRKRKWWTGYALSLVLTCGVGAFFFFLLSERFLPKSEQQKEHISQARWLYWCPPTFASGELRETSPCYYVNREGLVVAKAPRLEGKLFAKLYDEQESKTDENVRGGNQGIEESTLAYVKQFYEFGQFIIKNKDTLEIGWPDAMRVIASLNDNPVTVAENLALILEKEIGDRRDEVDYIDLRFGNRVYYKFR